MSVGMASLNGFELAMFDPRMFEISQDIFSKKFFSIFSILIILTIISPRDVYEKWRGKLFQLSIFATGWVWGANETGLFEVVFVFIYLGTCPGLDL